MHADVNTAVHAIFSHGLALRDRLEAGESLKLESTRAALLALLAPLAPLATEEAADAGEDEPVDFDFEKSDAEHQDDQGRLSQATTRYALTCWLDELILQSSLGDRWRNFTLESVLFVDKLRTKKFWDEARYAEIRGDVAALDVMYWCVMLGFRGDWSKKLDQIEAWTTRIRELLEKSGARMEPESREGQPVPRGTVPPAGYPMQRMLFSALVTLSCLAPLALLIFWRC